MLTDDQPVHEITATELGRTVSQTLDRVAAGERLIVTRNGGTAAVIVSIETGIELMLAGSERFTLMRREAHEELDRALAQTLPSWRRGSGERW